jgi:hypothetical protein
MIYHSITKYLFCGILVCGLFPLFAQNSSIQDDSALRVSIKDQWFTADPPLVLKNKPFVYTLPGGGPIQVRAEARGDEFMVILARERNGAYPGWAQGSWIFTRLLSTGRAERIRIFPRSDPMAYVQFRPMGENPALGTRTIGSTDKTLMDVVIQEAYIVRGLPLGIPFERFLTMPLEETLAAAGDKFPRRYFEPDPRMYRDIRSFVSKVRSGLPGLKFLEDGALDENSRYVYIRDLSPQAPAGRGLNCSGFAKWIVDGILFPVTGKRLAVTPLKQASAPRTSSLTSNFEDLRDTYFGLDWTRNLAVEAARVFRGPGLAAVEEVEVREETFAAVVDRSRGTASAKSYPGFLLNAGFSMEGLRPLLYTLAVNEPGNIYLASVNNETKGPGAAKGLIIRQHYHIAVLVPYFNEYGVFQVAVFESAEETSFAGFIGRHPGSMVNLTRIPVEGNFQP